MDEKRTRSKSTRKYDDIKRDIVLNGHFNILASRRLQGCLGDGDVSVLGLVRLSVGDAGNIIIRVIGDFCVNCGPTIQALLSDCWPFAGYRFGQLRLTANSG